MEQRLRMGWRDLIEELRLRREVVLRASSFLLFLMLSFGGANGRKLNKERIDVQNQTSAPIRKLDIGKGIESEASGGQKETYQVELSAGQYAKIVITQVGIDVAATLLAPDGKVVGEFDSEIRNHGEEEVWYVAAVQGTHSLVVQTKGRASLKGLYQIRLEDVHEATAKERALQQAQDFNIEFRKLYGARRLDAAIENAEKVLEIRKRQLGDKHPDVAAVLNNLGLAYRDRGDLDEAENRLREAQAIRETVFGKEHPAVANTRANLATVYSIKGQLAQAEELYKSAIAIFDASLGPDHVASASAHEGLAIVYRERADYVQAEASHLHALRIKRENLGATHTDVGVTLSNLGIVYRRKGDYSKAEETYLAALKIFEANLGPEHLFVANACNNLGLVYNDIGDFTKAEQFHQRAFKIRSKVLGAEHPDVAGSLNNLAVLNHNRGNFAEAEKLYQQALTIWEKRLGEEHPLTTSPILNLGMLYLDQGQYAKAEGFLERALRLRRKALGPDHPDVAFCLDILTSLYEAEDKIQKAIEVQSEACEITERNIVLNIAAGSERQKLAYLERLAEQTDHVVSLHTRYAPNNPTAAKLALNVILQRKGRTLDALANNFAELRRRADPDAKALLDRLIETRSKLAKLVVEGPLGITVEEHRAATEKLNREAEQLESELNGRNTEFRSQSQLISLAAVQAAIPIDFALVEFLVYRPFDAKVTKPGEALGEPHYVVYVTDRAGDVRWKDLGETRTIEPLIDSWRKELSAPKHAASSKTVQDLGRAVDDRVMRPVRALLGKASHLLLSPDGNLNLIPFAALVNENGRYLVEDYSMSYLTSGRDLLRLQIARGSKTDPLVFADPAYGEQLSDRPKANERDPLEGIYFGPLLTADEGKEIKRLAPTSRLLMKKDASEAALKSAHAPRFLHIATHGFFLPDADSITRSGYSYKQATPRTSMSDLASGRGMNVANPLLRSGFALAGANRRSDGAEDGIVTALEVSGIDLWGTKLVVLSACNTGVGEIRNGEGVYGLRRALVLAGSESQVISLWKVKDDATRDLMIEYYTLLLRNHAGREEALRQVQIKWSKRHPYYWASFIESGEWANLDGKR